MSMNDFCVERISVPAILRAEHGVLRPQALRVSADAGQAAARLLDQAREQAGLILAEARQEAGQAVQQQRQDVVRQATQLLDGLRQAQQDMLARMEHVVVELAQEVYDRLMLELTPRERIAAMFRRVQQEAPGKLVEPVVWLHPDDLALAPDSVWERKADARLTVGTCRLEAASGEWRAEFQLASDELRTAITQVGPPAAEGPGTL
jgi:flagellar biosynthesis/type III secretory pathway protein FliH